MGALRAAERLLVGRMRLAARRDAYHGEIRDRLRDRGYRVHDTAGLGDGYPDLHVSRGGLAVLVEVKSPGGSFTPAEDAFARSWAGPYVVALSWRDVVEWFREAGAENS